MARQLAALSQPFLGVALPISNVPGASGITGLAQVLAGKPDGYTIGVYIADTLATIPTGLARHKPEDFEWIVRTQVADSFLFVKSDGPFPTIQELFKHAQANPGKLRVASTGFGSLDDVTVRYLEKKGYRMTTVPYPRPGERYAATLGGHAEVLYEQAGDVQQYVKAGQLKPLIIFAEQRQSPSPTCPARRSWGSRSTCRSSVASWRRRGSRPGREDHGRGLPQGDGDARVEEVRGRVVYAGRQLSGPGQVRPVDRDRGQYARPLRQGIRAQEIGLTPRSDPMTLSRQMVAPALGVIASCLLLLATAGLDQGVPGGRLGPAFWPRLVLACLAGTCLVRLAGSLRGRSTTAAAGPDRRPCDGVLPTRPSRWIVRPGRSRGRGLARP